MRVVTCAMEIPTANAGSISTAPRGARTTQQMNRYAVVDPDGITPKRIAEYIANREGIELPSTGAIDAVWNRWVKMDFAEKGSKPVRFLGFTSGETQTIEELERVKYKYKQDARRQQADDKRNLRR